MAKPFEWGKIIRQKQKLEFNIFLSMIKELAL